MTDTTAATPIRLRGVRQNNLRGIDVDLPYDRMTVVTGVSGSGKSSLVFDTLYAEGQRRYVESFSAYARQFLERMPRPLADRIDDLPAAVAVEQANPVRTSRSTVGTMTELTDHLKLLFAKAATLHCGSCGGAVDVEDEGRVADAVAGLPDGTRVTLTFPLPPPAGLPFEDQARGLRAAGLARVVDPSTGEVRDVGDVAEPAAGAAPYEVVADRFVAGRVERSRVLGSAEQALRLGRDRAALRVDDGRVLRFSRALHCAKCDVAYRPAQANLFSFNSPLGACPACRGFGRTVEMDEGAMVPDPAKTLARGAIRPWTTRASFKERRALAAFCARRMISMDTPWSGLPAEHRRAIVDGTDEFPGLAGWMRWLETKTYKMHVRVLLSRYRRYVLCAQCGGTRRRPESLLWRLGGRNVSEWETEPIGRTLDRLAALALAPQAEAVVKIVREGIESRLRYLVDVGLGYLTLDRATRTLSGGEFQRVNLATALGAALVHTLYVLDEPSVGLHPRDTSRLLGILHRLRDRGNTLVVVEHDPETIAAADHVVDLGPGAGDHGGTVLFQGPLADLRGSRESVTARFLRGEERVAERRAAPRRPRGELVLGGCSGNNLRDVDLRIPVGCLTAVCGVSGGGKSSLITGTLFPAMERHFGRPADEPLPHRALLGADRFRECLLVDQTPIGRTPRSNPATYTGAMTHIRNLYGQTPDARRMRLSPRSFSFNSRGGRCPTCEGAGQEQLEMHFLADVFVPCSECEGRRFKPEVLEVRHRGRNVNDVLAMTVDDAVAFFHTDAVLESRLRETLDPLRAVGLSYLRLGQSATTLSGGEAQRLKLAGYLSRTGTKTLFLFDEPTTGLHLADVRTLLACLDRLVDAGHTVVVVEHHLSVIAAADHVIEVGPGGGEHGGLVVAEGTPGEVARGATPTAPFLLATEPGTFFGKVDSRPVTAGPASTSRKIVPGSVSVRGCRVHNLRGIDADVPHGKMTVVTGVSGSGKSSFAFDTVFAEGRRRYLESLSAYARQFVAELPRPDVDLVEGLPPTVSLDQRSTRGGTRQTVASMAEVLDFLRLLWARLGTRHCEQCGKPVTAASREEIVDRIAALGRERRRRSVHLLAPMVRRRKGFHRDVFDLLSRLGITTARVDGLARPVEPPPTLSRFHEHSIEALVATAAIESRDRDSLRRGVDAALDRGGGTLYASFDAALATILVFSSTAACADCGTAYGPLDPGELSWSTKSGMCRTCRGRGVPEDGDAGAAPCGACGGARLSPAARSVKFRGLGLHEYLAMPADAARQWLAAAEPRDERERAVLAPILAETSSRLRFVEEVGLSYLTLDRPARTLSGGEAQRIRLAAQLGTGLRGVCYVLDEPTIGLHPTDNARLLATLASLRDRGATLLVVEHDEETIRAADHVIDLGPGAGVHGGTVVAVGTPAELAANPASVTGPWLAGRRRIGTESDFRSPSSTDPKLRSEPAMGRTVKRSPTRSLLLRGVTARNLKSIDVRFPVGALTCVTGVSGSGKSTLVRDVLHPALLAALGQKGPEPGPLAGLDGAEHVTGVLEIDQSPIGRTSRSVPATYTGIMDPLRAVFAESVEARVRGFTASRFSFNSADGQCPSCRGQGRVTVEMNFLPDAAVPCEACGGARYGEETLAVRFQGRTIAEALALPVSEARAAFAAFPKIARVLDVLDEVGLGYLRLGQSSPTLSGGEAQRVKLAAEMAKRARGSIVYLLDEPTTGLHLADVEKLVHVLRGLVALGNTVVVIEHHLDVIACADAVIDLGPGGGAAGGRLVAYGTPGEVARTKGSATGACLARKFAR